MEVFVFQIQIWMAFIVKDLIANKSAEFHVMAKEATTIYLIQRWQNPLSNMCIITRQLVNKISLLSNIFMKSKCWMMSFFNYIDKSIVLSKSHLILYI